MMYIPKKKAIRDKAVKKAKKKMDKNKTTKKKPKVY
tara:strand:+ start:192 stop:299 length:108 start_codon:yes stop_codon:yes gene_type:complete